MKQYLSNLFRRPGVHIDVRPVLKANEFLRPPQSAPTMPTTRPTLLSVNIKRRS